MSAKQESPAGGAAVAASGRTRSLHVKRVPWSVWARARQNALQSGIPFREFVIALLATSTPIPAKDDECRETVVTPG